MDRNMVQRSKRSPPVKKIAKFDLISPLDFSRMRSYMLCVCLSHQYISTSTTQSLI